MAQRTGGGISIGQQKIYPTLPFPAGKITNHRVKSALFPSHRKDIILLSQSEAHFFNVDSVFRVLYSYGC